MPRKSSVTHGPLLLFFGTGITTLCFEMLGATPSFQHSLNNLYQKSTRMTLLIISAISPSFPGAALPFNLPRAHTTSCLILSSSRSKVLLCVFRSDASLHPLLGCPAFRSPLKWSFHMALLYICLHFTQAGATVVQAWYCYSCASLMAAPCAEWHIALLLHRTLFSGFLRSVAFLPQAFHSQLIRFCRSRRTPSPTLLCIGAMRSGQVFNACIVRRFPLGTLHLYKCWITLSWCTKYPSKDNLPLPLLARKWDNRQSIGKTIGKAVVRQSWHITPFLHIWLICMRGMSYALCACLVILYIGAYIHTTGAAWQEWMIHWECSSILLSLFVRFPDLCTMDALHTCMPSLSASFCSGRCVHIVFIGSGWRWDLWVYQSTHYVFIDATWYRNVSSFCYWAKQYF